MDKSPGQKWVNRPTGNDLSQTEITSQTDNTKSFCFQKHTFGTFGKYWSVLLIISFSVMRRRRYLLACVKLLINVLFEIKKKSLSHLKNCNSTFLYE